MIDPMGISLTAAVGLAAVALAPPATAAPTVVSAAHPAPLARAAARPPAVLLRDLRMCTKAAYNARAYRCSRDERRRPAVSTAALCTIEVRAFSAVTVRARMEFAGGTQYSITRKVPRRTRLQLAFGVEFPATMPAGAFTCRFTAGKQKASARMRSAGPAGPVVWTAACDSTLLRPDGSGCGTDQSTAPLASTSSLGCSAWAVGQQGKAVTVELLFESGGVWTRVDGADLRPRRPISALSITVPSALGAPFAPGSYACRFSVEGRLLGEKLFTVG